MHLIHHGKKLTKLCLFVFTVFIFGCSASEDESMENRKAYWAVMHQTNSVMDVRVNGVPLYKNDSYFNDTLSMPIHPLLTDGNNEIVFNFVDVIKKDDGMSFGVDNESNDDFYFEFSLDVLSKDSHRIGIVRVEKEDGVYVVTRPDSKEKNSVDNVEIISLEEAVESEFISFSGSVVRSNLIKVNINVSESSLRPLLWENSITMDPNDKNTNKLITNRYRDLYSYVKSNDFDSFLKEAAPVWVNTAYAFGMSTDIDDFVKESEADKIFVNESIDGLLNDFDFDDNDFKLEWTYGNRLVRILPRPLTWGDEEKTYSSPVLYMDKNGELKIASIALD
jgi:hypothetical protein